jgi:hypothetical protein
VRKATLDDAEAVARIWHSGWRDAGPFVYMAETEDGPFAVPSHRYEIDLTGR